MGNVCSRKCSTTNVKWISNPASSVDSHPLLLLKYITIARQKIPVKYQPNG